MLINVPTTPALLNRVSFNNFAYMINSSSSSKNKNRNTIIKKSNSRCCSIACKASGLFAAAEVIIAAASGAETPPQTQNQGETLSNIPQELSGECAEAKDCKKPRIQRPKSRKAESCTIKYVTACKRGGDGSAGEGPPNVRRPVVVFKEGFRSGRCCLVECSDICNLIGDGDGRP